MKFCCCAVAMICVVSFAHSQIVQLRLLQCGGIQLKQPFRGNRETKISPDYNIELGAECMFASKAQDLNEKLQLVYRYAELQYPLSSNTHFGIEARSIELKALASINNERRLREAFGIFYAYQLKPEGYGTGGNSFGGGSSYIATYPQEYDYHGWQYSNAGVLLETDWQAFRTRKLLISAAAQLNLLPYFNAPYYVNINAGTNPLYGRTISLNFAPVFLSIGLKEKIF